MLQIPICLLALWIAASGCDAAKTAISSDLLSTIAKTVASAFSPTLVGELQNNRTNRSSVTLARASQDKRLDELDTSSTSNSRIGRPVSAPISSDASLYAQGPYDPYFGRNDGARPLLDDYFGSGDGSVVPGRGVEASDRSPPIGLKRIDGLLPDRGILSRDSELGTPFTKFGENNFDRPDARFLASPIREDSKPYFAPFGFGGHYLPHGGYHGYPHRPYNGRKPSEQPEQAEETPTSENQEAEEGTEPADGNQPSQSPGGYNHGYHHGYKQFGFNPYGPYHYPVYPGHPNFYYPGHRHRPEQDPPEGENANTEDADGGSTPKKQQPGYPNFNPPYVNFHLQGYPAPFYGIYPHDRFHNVHNRNGTEFPPGAPYGAPYGAPFSPFPPFHNFYLPNPKKPNNQNPATTAAPENPDAERIADKVSSSESRFDETVRKIGANQFAANGIPLSAYAPKRDLLIDRYLFAENGDGYENLSNLKY